MLATSPRSVLVVEDDELLREALLDLLTDAGFHAHGVARVSDALLRTAAVRFDALLVDETLPDGRGSDLLRLLELDGRLAQCQAVLMTGLASFAGAHGYPLLAKPVDSETLVALLRRSAGALPVEAQNKSGAA